MIESLLYHYWVYFHLSWLNICISNIIENLEIWHDWIYLFDLINSVLWSIFISSILWYDLIHLIPRFRLINFTRLFFFFHFFWRWLKTLPITFQVILLVRPRSHMKYMSTIYCYISNGFIYSNLIWTRNGGLAQTLISIILFISCVQVIVIFICSVFQRATVPPFRKNVFLDVWIFECVFAWPTHCSSGIFRNFRCWVDDKQKVFISDSA